jgi:hypothetical protein
VLYEVREYVAVPGRFPALVTMFNDHSIPLFAKHEMDLVSVGMTWVGDNSFNELIYTMRFDDVTELEFKWARYLQDPEFLAASAEYDAQGPVVQSLRRRLIDSGPFARAISGTPG